MNCLRLALLVVALVALSLAKICSITIPDNPLTAVGLSTPYLVDGCDQANADEASFVQGAVIDLATGQISIYNPLIINNGDQPSIPPVVPTLPAQNVVAIWFGTNAAGITFQGNSLTQAQCVNGQQNTGNFGQFAYCNAPAFFKAANDAIDNGLLVVPDLPVAADGLPCPTTRDFFVVDQDQSDNVDTSYLIDANGKMAQNTAANRAQLGTFTVLDNGSDNGLLAAFINPALTCPGWQAPDLADPGSMVAALPLHELQADRKQAYPMALVPGGDPMVVSSDGTQDVNKVNAYRVGVNQIPAKNLNDANTVNYCMHFGRIAPLRMLGATTLLQNAPSPSADAANLMAFMAARFIAAYGPDNLNCTGLLGSDVMMSTSMSGGKVTGVNIDRNDIIPDFQDAGAKNPYVNSAAALQPLFAVFALVILLCIQ